VGRRLRFYERGSSFEISGMWVTFRDPMDVGHSLRSSIHGEWFPKISRRGAKAEWDYPMEWSSCCVVNL
jgi:hypothetical protein